MSTIIAGGLTNTPTDPSLFGGATPEQVAAAVADYIAKNPVNAPSAEQIASAVEEYLKNNPSGGGSDADTLDGKHASDFASAGHTHSYNDLKDKPTAPTIPDSLPANGGNADTVGGKTAEQIQHAAEAAIPTAVNTALQAAKESGEFNGESPVIEMSGTAEGTILRVVNADGGEEEVLIRDGRNGEPGLNGLSAYQVAEQQGFEGTSKEWLDSLIGPKGNDGISVTNAEINSNGQLVLSFSNGQSATLGKVVGTNGTNGVSATHSWNGTILTITSASGSSSVDLKGEKGDSVKGDDGVSPTVAVSKSGKVTTVSITDKNGTTTATINDGADGKTPVKGTDYVDGKDGASVTVSSVSESSVDGGSNVVTFSDGKKLNVRNGKTGTPGKTPEKGVDYFTEADKVEMVERVRTSMGDVPDYWQAALDEGVEAINTALCNAGRNKSAFLFYSDTHWNYGSGMAPALLKHLYQHTGMNKTFFGGDIVNDEATDYDTMEYLWDWRRQLKGLPNHHSVPGNHDDGNSTNNLFSEEYVYGYLLASEETHDMVCGDKGLYYYVDNPAEKTRYLCLDTGFKDASALSDDQKEFIKASLKSVPDGWHIVVVAHIWYGLDYDQYDKRPVPVAGLSATASSVLAILDNYNSRNGEFSECGGWVEFCIGGHIHYDYDAVSATGIPIILVETDSHHTRGCYTATVGTATESAVSGIVADYSAHKIHVIRIGRGASREVEVTNYVVSYTNVLPLALAADGVSVYNADDTPGYKADTRWSSSSNAEGSSTGTYITGWIPAKAGDVIRLKNITMPHVNGNTCTIHYFNNSFTTAAQNIGVNSGFTVENYAIVKDENNNVVQFTIPANALLTHIRIQCGGIDDTSIITINEPIE